MVSSQLVKNAWASSKNKKCWAYMGWNGDRSPSKRWRRRWETKKYMHCSHLYNRNTNFIVDRWLGDNSKAFNDAYALAELFQWVWRSRIRKVKPITFYLPSPRMRKLAEAWLYDWGWWSQSDSNAQPSVSKTDALSNWAMGPSWFVTIIKLPNIGLFFINFEINNNQPFSHLSWSRETSMGAKVSFWNMELISLLAWL